ncbi:MAG: heme A synthase [Betaproteobacteria bacterium RIFCSPLOWO2_02_FULL_66_14]|nr:MAG: heme A synthase [Betaproteobacteria bacterium RIFCSPLOWO2_02_FULL_66_14]
MTPTDRRNVAVWLLLCAAMVFVIVVVGGITRLTHSGLSIVEWQPLVGTLPPLSHADWELLFAKYRETPEFKLVNFDIDLAGFQSIFWWEWIHRLLGRLIGAVFLLPFLWFLVRGRLERSLAWKLCGVFLLGALQGALGWYMVKSGLVEDPRVSHFRLTAHLGVALAIFAAELWIALDLLAPASVARSKARFGNFALGIAVLVFVMSLTGGFVAGLRAGHAYNTFPLMNGNFIPPEILMLDPWWKNFLYNMATVQFVHRGIGWILIVLVPLLWWRATTAGLEPRQRLACQVLVIALLLQVTLGIATLLLAVPVSLGAAHQGGAVVVLAAALWTAHELRAPESLRTRDVGCAPSASPV